LQMLVKEGHGFTLIREGTALDDSLSQTQSQVMA
jgi:hypothetical protein